MLPFSYATCFRCLIFPLPILPLPKLPLPNFSCAFFPLPFSPFSLYSGGSWHAKAVRAFEEEKRYYITASHYTARYCISPARHSTPCTTHCHASHCPSSPITHHLAKNLTLTYYSHFCNSSLLVHCTRINLPAAYLPAHPLSVVFPL